MMPNCIMFPEHHLHRMATVFCWKTKVTIQILLLVTKYLLVVRYQPLYTNSENHYRGHGIFRVILLVSTFDSIPFTTEYVTRATNYTAVHQPFGT